MATLWPVYYIYVCVCVSVFLIHRVPTTKISMILFIDVVEVETNCDR